MEVDYNKIEKLGFNNYIRSIISSNMLDDISKNSFINTVINILSNTERNNRVLNDALTSVLFLDRYKNLYDAVTTGYYDYYALASFKYYDNIGSLFDIRYFYLTNQDELIKALDSSRYFYDGHPMFKSLLMCQLTKDDDSYLNGITKFHELDVKDFKRILTKEELYSYICNERSILKETNIDNDYDDIFVLNMTNYIQKVFLYDPKSIQELIDDIIKNIFCNYHKLSEREQENFKGIIMLKEKNKDDFNYTCLYHKEILSAVILLYVTMMDNNIIKQMKYIKE